ncbi:hypothetical protein NECID01_1027 [Nematocida sp. AWRm77]|nr:hypothetical protein NECID01_1027 [Nematocida sp. AWRm77]
MFDNFTIRTVQKDTSTFPTERGFSLLKLLSPDPLQFLSSEEFLVLTVLTLFLALLYYIYHVLKRKILKRLSGRRAVCEGKPETDPIK